MIPGEVIFISIMMWTLTIGLAWALLMLIGHSSMDLYSNYKKRNEKSVTELHEERMRRLMDGRSGF